MPSCVVCDRVLSAPEDAHVSSSGLAHRECLTVCPDCDAGPGEPCVWACSSNWI